MVDFMGALLAPVLLLGVSPNQKKDLKVQKLANSCLVSSPFTNLA